VYYSRASKVWETAMTDVRLADFSGKGLTIGAALGLVGGGILGNAGLGLILGALIGLVFGPALATLNQSDH
jgi:hypothetical protein